MMHAFRILPRSHMHVGGCESCESCQTHGRLTMNFATTSRGFMANIQNSEKRNPYVAIIFDNDQGPTYSPLWDWGFSQLHLTASRAASITKGRRDLRRELGGSCESGYIVSLARSLPIHIQFNYME